MIPQSRFLTVVAAVQLICLSSLAQLEPSRLERAASGDATAMLLIGRASAVAGKSVEAYAWFSLAAEYGVETAEKTELFNTLSSAQVTDATRRIEEIRSTQLRGLPPSAKKPVARVVETKRAVEEKPVAPAPATPVMTRPSPATPIVTQPALDGHVKEQSAQIAKLEADLAATRAEVSDAKKQSAERTTQLDAALAKAGQERDALAAEISTLRRDKQRSEESLAQMQAKPSPDGQIEAQKAQIAKLETDLAAARSATSAATSKSDEKTTQLEAALAKAGQEKETLSAQIASLRQESLRDEEARDKIRAELSAVRSKLETDLAAAQTESRVANQKAGEATKLEATLAQATQERDALSGEIATLRRDKQRAEESLAQLQARPSLEGKVQEQTARIAKLESDLAAAHSEVSAAKEKLGETTQLGAALAKAGQEKETLAAEIATLRRDKQRAEESLAQLQAKPSLDGQVEAQKAQIAKLEADLATARSETTKLEAALAKAGQENPAPSAEIATLRQDRLRAEQARDQIRAELTAARSKLESNLAAAQTEARAAKAQIAKLEADLAAARSEARGGEAQFGESTAQLQDALAQANRDLTAEQIRNENLVRELARARPGMPLVSDNTPRAAPSRSPVSGPIDVPAPAALEPRIHTVSAGENLSIISNRHYGTPNRWREIFSANREVMQTEHHLVPGMQLRIP
ncbi:MAG TPA: hypothetical protein VMM36_13265 [Opitutaceae bacterium]|nr:hypothetical protein [Opitutaceae bacterium]